MIKINLDLIYLTRKFGVSANQIQQQSDGKSISEIMEQAGDAGNTEAAKFDSQVLENKNGLIEAFKLADPFNRFLILQSLDKNELMLFLQLMKPEDLARGLKFFTKEKVMELLKGLPQEMLFKMLKDVFTLEKIMQLIPEKEMDKFFTSNKMDQTALRKNIMDLPKHALAQILETVTGTPCKEKDKNGMLKQIKNLKNEELQEGVQGMAPEYKALLAGNLIKENSMFVKAFSSEALAEPFNELQKEDIIKNIGQNVKSDELVKMIDELPNEMLSMVATQLDVNVFADLLVQRFQDILAQVSVA